MQIVVTARQFHTAPFSSDVLPSGAVAEKSSATSVFTPRLLKQSTTACTATVWQDRKLGLSFMVFSAISLQIHFAEKNSNL
jgi:hypothetical protein